MIATLGILHTPSILPAHFEQRFRDLAQRADFAGFHEAFEYVFVVDGGFLDLPQLVRSPPGETLP